MVDQCHYFRIGNVFQLAQSKWNSFSEDNDFLKVSTGLFSFEMCEIMDIDEVRVIGSQMAHHFVSLEYLFSSRRLSYY